MWRILSTRQNPELSSGHPQIPQSQQRRLCTLLDKPERRVTDVSVDYCCFNIPDEFVVGYGLDYAQKYRNLPYIGVVEFETE